jgi:hypothetical protein
MPRVRRGLSKQNNGEDEREGFEPLLVLTPASLPKPTVRPW